MKSYLAFLQIVFLFNITFSQSWIRQNPFPQLSELQDISFDGSFGLAVGFESTILTTDNEGLTWEPRKAPHQGDFFQASLVVPGTSGQLMLAGGYNLILSRDGGETWEEVNVATQLIYKIQALPNGTLIVHDSDYAMRSTDQGETWEQFPMPGNNCRAGHFTSVMNGWVQHGGFNNNQVWVTTDGGQSWNVRDTLKHPVIAAIEMINDQVGFLGSRDYVYKTTDGGNHWIKMHNNAVNSILDLHVVNENELWTCENNGFIFYTLNGGGMWQEINPNIINSNRATGISANSSGKVWVTGKYVSISYSDDFGLTWSDQVPNSKATLIQPYFFDENIGIVGGSEGTLLRTTNGGASWDKIQFAIAESFFSVQMLGPQMMIIGSSSGRVFASADQGENWNIIGENLGQITDMHFFDSQTGIVVSEAGKIFRTMDGGTLWEEVYNDPGANFYGIDFVDQQRGWTCAWYGQILYTVDGGLTWDSQYDDDFSQFEDIHFTSDQEGWIIASNITDTIWHTVNGGVSWPASVLPYKTFWHGVSFTNPDTGWVCGGGAGFGIILRTNNGGQTWIIDHESPEALLGIYAIPDQETVWCTGFGGNIVKYSPCTFLPELSDLQGNSQPCERDTVTYTVQSSDVDLFDWDYPADWLVYGNPNTSSIQLIIGIMAGDISVAGKDACGNETSPLTITASPISVPDVIITEDSGLLSCNIGSGFYQWLLNGNPIPGATQQQYTATVSGKYEMVVTSFATGCEIRSNALQVVVNAVQQVDAETLVVFPNPSNGKVYFRLKNEDGRLPEGLFSMFSSEGKVQVNNEIFTGELDLSWYAAGIYLIVFQANKQVYSTKILLH